MTGPNPEATVTAKIVIDGETVEDDVRDAMRDAGDAAEDEGERSGRRGGRAFGDGFRDGMRDRLDQTDPNEILSAFRELLSSILRRAGVSGSDEFASSFTASLPDHLERHRRDIDRDLGRSFRRTGTSVAIGVLEGFMSIVQGGRGAVSFFSSFGGLFASFGSNAATLLLVVLPTIGAVVGLITAAVYWLQALTSLLYLIPSLLLAIGIQGLALGLIFNGASEAFSTVFSAKNVKEAENLLDKIEGLNGELKEFALGLFPLKKFFSDLQQIAQTQFFGQLNLEGQLQKIVETIGPTLETVIGRVSAALGIAINDILGAFATPEFTAALSVLGDSIVQWLTGGEGGMGFGEAINKLAEGLNIFAVAIDPFLDWFGQEFNEFIYNLGVQLEELSKDPEFFQWLEDAKVIISDGILLIGELWRWIKLIVDKFIEADKDLRERGGTGFLDTITLLLDKFLDFFDSEIGMKAMQGFIELLLILIVAFGLLAIGVGIALAFFANFFDLLLYIFDPEEGLIADIGDFLLGIAKDVIDFFLDIGEQLGRARTTIETAAGNIRDFIANFFDDAITWLVDAGRNIVQGLIDGINAMAEPMRAAVNGIMSIWEAATPFSPAKEGPLSGKGDPFLGGKRIVDRLAAGITAEASALTSATNNAFSNIAFGSGAVQINNYGSTPTASQSRLMGAAAGRGLMSQLNATNLAARTL